MPEAQLCETCGGPLDWRGRCMTCASLERLRGRIAATGGFREKRNRRKRTAETEKPKTWNGPSGVDNALPNGDRLD